MISPPRSLVLRPGSVLETYPGLGAGNYLYFALQAFSERRRGRRAWVLDSGLDPVWTDAFPALRPLLTTRRGAALRRRRHIPSRFCQTCGVDFAPAELEEFTSKVVLPSVPLSRTRGPDVGVNVRRGDYYDNPAFRALYGFDTSDYVCRAVIQATHGSHPRWLSVVSDDPGWCESSLGWLSKYAERVTFGAQTAGPVGDFVEVAGARALVLTNSTFSYWAGYTSQVLHGRDHRGVWVPDFHQRNIDGGRPWQHDPRWHAIKVTHTPA